MSDARLYAPATLRNREVIARHLGTILPKSGTVLEIASGSGEHVVYLAALLSHLRFQPTDRDPAALASIDAWASHAAVDNVLAAVPLDAASGVWPVRHADAILCVNMIHISPWEATIGLFDNAARVLPPHAPLVLYGPFRQTGNTLAPSNVEFDMSLRGRDARWGLRLLEDVTALASAFEVPEVIEVPANNLVVAYRKKKAVLF